ncbi:hypothetical protein HQQ81_08425 [Microbacteriaceae bacterium VKM Ac-2854]|nr:hypothetical protein [Microbacteriaceae bacterium VKM Ac-2854]
MFSPLRLVPLALAAVLLTGCAAAAPSADSSARPTPTITTAAAPLDTRIVSVRSAAEPVLADARAVLALSAGVVDEDRRAVLSAAITDLESAHLGTSVPALEAATTAATAGIRVVAGRIVELGQAALDESGSADDGARTAVSDALTALRTVLDARTAAEPSASAVVTASAAVRSSQQANLAAAEAARQSAAELEAEDLAAEEEADESDCCTPDTVITLTPTPLVLPDFELLPPPPTLQEPIVVPSP